MLFVINPPAGSAAKRGQRTSMTTNEDEAAEKEKWEERENDEKEKGEERGWQVEEGGRG